MNIAFCEYSNQKISVISQMNCTLEVKPFDMVPILFIYSDKQIINVNIEKGIYEIKSKYIKIWLWKIVFI